MTFTVYSDLKILIKILNFQKFAIIVFMSQGVKTDRNNPFQINQNSIIESKYLIGVKMAEL